MSVTEIARRLVDGVWTTGPANESAGGGGAQPDITDGTTTVSASTIRFASGLVTDEGGGVASIAVNMRLLGPFPISFDDPGIADDGVLVTALEAGSIVVAVGVFVDTPWDGGVVRLAIELGGPDLGPPDDDYAQIANFDVSYFTTGNGYRVSNALGSVDAALGGNPPSGFLIWSSGFGLLTVDGGLVAYAPGGSPTQGLANLYAMVASPLT